MFEGKARLKMRRSVFISLRWKAKTLVKINGFLLVVCFAYKLEVLSFDAN